MSRLHRHLPNSIWILAGVVAAGVLVAVLMLLTDSPPREQGGSWVQDARGVWVAKGTPYEKPADVRQQEFLIREAQLALKVIKDQQQDLSSGPCLGTIFQDWVADIAHTPRQAIDDDLANQCKEYQDGQAGHFIELSADGDVLRVQ